MLNPYDGKVFPAQNLSAELALLGKITNDIDVLLLNKETNAIMRVLLSGRPIIDNENNIAAVVVTIKDISRYKRLETELEKKDQESRRRIGFKSNQSKKEE
ncbi:hypothetical protein [Tenacibaculum sp. L6]|uniref:hypothetical protein n=1 Tax=Tenacibaculum sp. L6 TaxID=2992764 RepID=UPI00237B0887|nr:hypothetical protein [Tenacibaculum sp. L6]MDE0537001.1 hypothetical protein [Tenacibaculum sp. L6]